MVKTISARDAGEHFGDLLGSLDDTQEPIVVERDGQPIAVVISISFFMRLQAGETDEWSSIERLRQRNAQIDPEEAWRDATAAVVQARR